MHESFEARSVLRVRGGCEGPLCVPKEQQHTRTQRRPRPAWPHLSTRTCSTPVLAPFKGKLSYQVFSGSKPRQGGFPLHV
ncbi:hypothetical protein E2C01_098382 [Portunus trituberculatus]|uniref:Uncharacterized protein n=1 Tax=Portunus trituberculatus TaxID=210409 RepID=A0A5B7KBY7_PORTR|nr:hypothetical protein [Portunus trituberculatus]